MKWQHEEYWRAGAKLAGKRHIAFSIVFHNAKGKWVAIALETSKDPDGPSVLEEHAHKFVGDFATQAAARRACEAFLRKHRRHRSLERCGCTK